jgi:protein-S-isoprenylcysteine O-methyltransferase Ste14
MFRLLALAIFVPTLIVGVYFRYQSEKAREKLPWREEGVSTMILLRLFGLAGWLSIAVYLINPALMSWSEMILPVWLRWTGVVAGLISVPLLYWLFKSIGKNISQTVGTRKEHQLVTTGPYRWIRHPLYSVGTLMALSIALIASNWFIAIAVLGALVMLLVRLPKEEANLITRFGSDYTDYMERTGRLLPRLW